MRELVIKCRPLVGGKALGEALVTQESISFWGGLDPRTGVIIEKGHELQGLSVAGKILIFPYGKGSCTGSTVLLEAIRCGKSPLGIINLKTEPIIVAGVILAKKLYGKSIPVVDKPHSPNFFKMVKTGDRVEIDADSGIIKINKTV